MVKVIASTSNTPPYFDTTPIDIVLIPGVSSSYTYPATIEDQNQSVTTTTTMTGGATLLAFISDAGSGLNFAPQTANIGKYQIDIKLSDGGLSKTYTINVEVLPNEPPTFSAVFEDQKVSINFTASYTLPSFSDVNNDVIKVTAVEATKTSLPPFVTLSGSTFQFAPKLSTHAGLYQI